MNGQTKEQPFLLKDEKKKKKMECEKRSFVTKYS